MLTKEEFVKTHPDVRVGMTAYSMDGEKLGVIERIDEDNLMIERGWFFHKDFTIPYDDIEDIREDRMIVRQRHEDFERERTEKGRREEPGVTGRTGGMGEYERGGEEEVSGYGRGRETEEARIPVREEELEAEKRAKESEVGIRKDVRTETEHLEVPVQKEEVIVERASAEESGTSESEMGEKAFQEEEMRIPVQEEEVEVTKRPVVKEEVRVRKESRTENEPVSGEVRKEEVKVEPAKPAKKK